MTYEEYQRIWEEFEHAVYGNAPSNDLSKRKELSIVINDLWALHHRGDIEKMDGIPKPREINHLGKNGLDNLIKDLRDRFFPDMDIAA